MPVERRLNPCSRPRADVIVSVGYADVMNSVSALSGLLHICRFCIDDVMGVRPTVSDLRIVDPTVVSVLTPQANEEAFAASPRTSSCSLLKQAWEVM